MARCIDCARFRFSSLYIGILAATRIPHACKPASVVSVPFTSGSSLQPFLRTKSFELFLQRFSSLYIGILAATSTTDTYASCLPLFQFPLHRDPRCNMSFVTASRLSMKMGFSSLYIGILAATNRGSRYGGHHGRFSSLYIGILAATCRKCRTNG